MCSTEGWKEPVCERYGFLINEEWGQIDITHELLEKLGLEKGKEINFPIYIAEKALSKKPVYSAITIENEEEIFLDKPLSVKNLENELKKWLAEIANLKEKITNLEQEKEEKQENIANLQTEYNNLVNHIRQLEALLICSQTKITELKEWKDELKFNLVPSFWPDTFYTEDTPSVEVLVEEVKKLFLEKYTTRGELQEKENQIRELEGEKEELENRLDEKDAEINRLNAELEKERSWWDRWISDKTGLTEDGIPLRACDNNAGGGLFPTMIYNAPQGRREGLPCEITLSRYNDDSCLWVRVSYSQQRFRNIMENMLGEPSPGRVQLLAAQGLKMFIKSVCEYYKRQM